MDIQNRYLIVATMFAFVVVAILGLRLLVPNVEEPEVTTPSTPSTPTVESTDIPSLPPTENSSVVVVEFGGESLLAPECANKSYVRQNCDYIVEGTVVKVESYKSEQGIFTYSDLSIEKYTKGTNLGDVMRIRTPGGTFGDVAQYVEDQPILHTGVKVRLYLKAIDGGLEIFCGQAGIEEI